MSTNEDALIVKALHTPEGRRLLKASIQLAAARAADKFAPGSRGERRARKLAGLPAKKR